MSVEFLDPITAPVYEAIELADVHQLLRLEQTNIPHLKGITDAQRQDLQRAVRERWEGFSQANAAASNQTPRWK